MERKKQGNRSFKDKVRVFFTGGKRSTEGANRSKGGSSGENGDLRGADVAIEPNKEERQRLKELNERIKTAYEQISSFPGDVPPSVEIFKSGDAYGLLRSDDPFPIDEAGHWICQHIMTKEEVKKENYDLYHVTVDVNALLSEHSHENQIETAKCVHGYFKVILRTRKGNKIDGEILKERIINLAKGDKIIINTNEFHEFEGKGVLIVRFDPQLEIIEDE